MKQHKEIPKDLKPVLAAARTAAASLETACSEAKNRALSEIAKLLERHAQTVLSENALDVKDAQNAGRPAAIIDRMLLSRPRIDSMIKGILDVVSLPDPVGEIYDMAVRPNGLRVGRMRLPLGVIGIIFEARPNVITDAGALCLKSGNASILRGGSECARSNGIIGDVIGEALEKSGVDRNSIQVIRDPDRELVSQMLSARGHIDLLIPRGGESLIRFVDENAKVPLVFHYKGVCHVFVDESADPGKALPIVMNAKVQRPGVCNAMETLLVHKKIAASFLPEAAAQLALKRVELRGCPEARRLVPSMKEAAERDWYEEYLDLILAVKVVDGIDEAIAHIRKYGSSHTEAIVTESLGNAGRFLREVGSSCVAVNASTRFNDGGELGLGAEIGISTSKLHAFGPMGLRELTSSKFIVLGSGQVRG